MTETPGNPPVPPGQPPSERPDRADPTTPLPASSSEEPLAPTEPAAEPAEPTESIEAAEPTESIEATPAEPLADSPSVLTIDDPPTAAASHESSSATPSDVPPAAPGEVPPLAPSFGQSPPTPPPPPPPAPPWTPSSSDSGSRGNFFDAIRSFGAARPTSGRWFAGVAAGLGRRWGIDPLLVRGIFVALTIFGGLGVLLYGLAWALMPEDDGRIALQQGVRGNVTAGLVGAAIVVLFGLGAVGGPGDGPGPGGWFPGPLLLIPIALGIWWFASHRHHHPTASAPSGPAPSAYATTPAIGSPTTAGDDLGAARTSATPADTAAPVYGSPTPGSYGAGGSGTGLYTSYGDPAATVDTQDSPSIPAVPPGTPRVPAADRASHRITRVTLGMALVAAALVILIDRFGGNSDGGTVFVLAAASALAVIAAGVLTAGAIGRKSGGLAPIGILLAVVLINSAVIAGSSVSDGRMFASIGERTWRPVSLADAEAERDLGVGQGTLWLTDRAVLAGATAAEPVDAQARIGAGQLTIVLPEGVPAEVRTQIGSGELVKPSGDRESFDGGSRGWDSWWNDDEPRVRPDSSGDDGRRTIRTGPAGDPVIVVDAELGFGELVVRTASPSGGTSLTPVPTPTPATAITPTASAVPTPTQKG